MATHNTENYLDNIFPEGTVPAGVLLCNTAKFIANTDTIAVGDVINFMTLPKGAIIVDVLVQADDTTDTATLDVGLTTKSTGVVVDADGLWKVLPIGTGPVTASFYGGVDSAGAGISLATHKGALGQNYKTLAEVIVTGTIGAAVVADDDEITITVLYFMDYGQDLATDQTNA